MTTSMQFFRPILDAFSVPFKARTADRLDCRCLSDHFMRDVGLLDGKVLAGSIR